MIKSDVLISKASNEIYMLRSSPSPNGRTIEQMEQFKAFLESNPSETFIQQQINSVANKIIACDNAIQRIKSKGYHEDHECKLIAECKATYGHSKLKIQHRYLSLFF